MKLNAQFVNALNNIDRQQTIHSTQTPKQQSLPTLINLATRLQGMELIPLELQPTLSMSRRKAREAYLIDRGKTLSPDRLNRRNEHS